MNFETLILKKEAYVATLILNRPERLNVLNEKMFEEIGTVLDDAAKDGLDDDLRMLLREVGDPRDFLHELRLRHAPAGSAHVPAPCCGRPATGGPMLRASGSGAAQIAQRSRCARVRQ